MHSATLGIVGLQESSIQGNFQVYGDKCDMRSSSASVDGTGGVQMLTWLSLAQGLLEVESICSRLLFVVIRQEEHVRIFIVRHAPHIHTCVAQLCALKHMMLMCRRRRTHVCVLPRV